VIGSEAALHAIVDASPVGVCITTDDGLFEHVNPAYERLCGWSAAELVGRHVSMVVAEGQRAALADRHDQFIARGVDVRGEDQIRTKDRSRRTVVTNAARVVGSDGRYRKVTFVVDVTDRSRLEADLGDAHERLAHLATHDSLTGLPNHRRTRELLDQATEVAERYGRGLAVAVVDLDHFKAINDSFGHLVGDDLLVAFARLLNAQLRAVDGAGRTGGEEFLVLMPETSPEDARIVLERLRDCCRDQIRTPQGHPLRFSAGVVEPLPNELPDAVLRRAELTMVRAKAGGRDRTEVG
jgi:diguanylate cyclase (GGDEF)-like protein/PAS domain S-box-containing protein